MHREKKVSLVELSSSFTIHSSFLDIAKHYDGFILDQFGVLHNGKSPLEGAQECVSTLVESMGKKCVILSNTSSPSDTAMAKLEKIGFDNAPKHFLGAITSGEEASKFIANNFGCANDEIEGMSLFTSTNPAKCIWLTWKDDSINSVSSQFLQKCGNIVPVNDVDDADFVIAHGSEVQRSLEPSENQNQLYYDIPLGTFMQTGNISREMNSTLLKCQKRNLPMVCANPDFIVNMADGTVGHMPGKIAHHYEAMGGKCHYFGKPYREHFLACLEVLGLKKEKVAHVGDSLQHDILGANMAGIDSIFVTGGIHCNDLGSSHNVGSIPNRKDLELLFAKEGGDDVRPTHVIPMFRI